MSALANEVSGQVSTQSIGMNSNIGKAPYLSRAFLGGGKSTAVAECLADGLP